MTERDYILARLQLEREQQMSGWNVPGPARTRVQPRAPRRALEAADEQWKGAAA